MFVVWVQFHKADACVVVKPIRAHASLFFLDET